MARFKICADHDRRIKKHNLCQNMIVKNSRVADRGDSLSRGGETSDSRTKRKSNRLSRYIVSWVASTSTRAALFTLLLSASARLFSELRYRDRNGALV